MDDRGTVGKVTCFVCFGVEEIFGDSGGCASVVEDECVDGMLLASPIQRSTVWSDERFV